MKLRINSALTRSAISLMLGAAAVLLLSGHLALAQSTAPDPTAAANPYFNAPRDWRMWFPAAGSPMQEKIDWLMKYVLWIMLGVVLFVTALLAYVMVRFHAARNPVPGHITHNTFIEVVWIVIPTLLLAIIIIPSINLIYYEADDSNPYMTVTVTGHQWYWEYNYNSVSGLDYS